MGQMQELAIIGNGGVEVPSHFQETTGEDEVSQAAIGEDKGIPTVREGIRAVLPLRRSGAVYAAVCAENPRGDAYEDD
jgi:hypothetical protein